MIKKIFYLGISLFLNKIFFILLPFFISAKEYNSFNSEFYTVSTMAIISLLGMDYAFARYKIKIVHLVIIICFVLSFVFTIFIFIDRNVSFLKLLLVLSMIINSIVFTICLFQNNLLHYFVFNLSTFISNFASILIYKSIGGSFFVIFSILNLIFSFCYVAFYYNKKHISRTTILNLTELVYIALSIFFINSFASLVFSIDKYLINSCFDKFTANAFTYSWQIIVPSLYIGNIFEKYIYSNNDKSLYNKKNLMIFGINAFVMILYFGIILIAINFDFAVPSSIDKQKLIGITVMLIPFMFLFEIIHFPYNGFLLKFCSTKVQNLIGVSNFLGLLMLIFLLFFVIKFQSVLLLVLCSFFVLISLNVLKLLLVNANSKKN